MNSSITTSIAYSGEVSITLRGLRYKKHNTGTSALLKLFADTLLRNNIDSDLITSRRLPAHIDILPATADITLAIIQQDPDYSKYSGRSMLLQTTPAIPGTRVDEVASPLKCSVSYSAILPKQIFDSQDWGATPAPTSFIVVLVDGACKNILAAAKVEDSDEPDSTENDTPAASIASLVTAQNTDALEVVLEWKMTLELCSPSTHGNS